MRCAAFAATGRPWPSPGCSRPFWSRSSPAPLYASQVAGTTPDENHLTDQVTIDGTPTDVVSLEGIPIGPTWRPKFLVGADENGRDLMVRVLYGGRTSLLIGAGALLLTALFAVPLALAAGYFRGRTDALISRLLDLLWSFPALLVGFLFASAINLHGAQIGPFTLEAGSKLIPVTVIGLVLLASAIVDLIIAWLDPRIRASSLPT